MTIITRKSTYQYKRLEKAMHSWPQIQKKYEETGIWVKIKKFFK